MRTALLTLAIVALVGFAACSNAPTQSRLNDIMDNGMSANDPSMDNMAASQKVSGKVLSTLSNGFNLKANSGKTTRIVVSSNTGFKPSGMGMSQIRAGARVQVMGRMSRGNMQATTVTMMGDGTTCDMDDHDACDGMMGNGMMGDNDHGCTNANHQNCGNASCNHDDDGNGCGGGGMGH